MGLALFSKCFPIVILLLVHRSSAQDDVYQYDPALIREKEALLALKDTLNSTFLNDNWMGMPCLEDNAFWYGLNCTNSHVTDIHLEGKGLAGNISNDAFSNLAELTSINLRSNSLSGYMMDFSQNQKLQRIDLSANMFYGPISQSLLTLNSLESLQLQGNQLTGSVPAFNQTSLEQFNVSNNHLRGAIPNTPTLRKFNEDSFHGNSDLHREKASNVPASANDVNHSGESNTTTSSNDKGKSSNHDISDMLLIFNIAGVVAVALLFTLYCRKSRELRKLMNANKADEPEYGIDDDTEDFGERKEQDKRISTDRKRVSSAKEEKGKLIFQGDEAGIELSDLLKASAEGLGKGLFGSTYKATLEGRPAVVVKRLRDLKPLTNEEFTQQAQLIGNLKHPNLLPLLAHFYSTDEKLFIYRYAQKGNLFNLLHSGRGTKERVPFRWNSRLSVARAVARALEYLHLSIRAENVIPHGNLKLSNVLIDEKDVVLVSDYALNSLVALPAAVQRMVAYKSPEYQSAKRLSRKSDVWSYGILLLELLTGRVSSYAAPPGVNGVDLGSWVHRAVREEWTAEIFDVEISVQRSAAPGMLKLLQIAIRCCERAPEKRPEMAEVVREVENIRIVESSEEEDFSVEHSLTDESMSTTASVIVEEERRS